MATGISLGSSASVLPSADIQTFSQSNIKNINPGVISNVTAIRIKHGANLKKVIKALLIKTEVLTSQNLSYSIFKLVDNKAITVSSIWLTATDNIEYNNKILLVKKSKVVNAGFLVPGNNTISVEKIQENYIGLNSTKTDSEIYVIVIKNLGAEPTEISVTFQWEEL